MPIPPEFVAVKQSLEPSVSALPIFTGMDIGVADYESPDFDNLVIRVFVSDLSAIPSGIPTTLDGFPVVLMQRRRYKLLGIPSPDIATYRPIMGGISTGPERTVDTPFPHIESGTLGAIVRRVSASSKPRLCGLSNFHVFGCDLSRKIGDNILQPERNPLRTTRTH